MEYKLAVVVLLIIYFIFAYQVGTNLEEYCLADNSRDSRLAYCGMLCSFLLAFAFLMWAKYEYDTNENAICNILVVVEEEKKRDEKLKYINSPDDNLKSAAEKNRIAQERADRANTTNPANTTNTSNSPPQLTPSPTYPTSEVDPYFAVDKSPERGNVNDYY